MEEKTSTLTIVLTAEETKLLECIKEEAGFKVATKAIKALLLYPERFKILLKDMQKVKNENTLLTNKLKEREALYNKALEDKDKQIQDIKEKVKNYFRSFEELKNI